MPLAKPRRDALAWCDIDWPCPLFGPHAPICFSRYATAGGALLHCLRHGGRMNPNPKFPTPSFINDLAGKLGEVMKQSPARDIEQNLKAGVTSMLGKLDMVSREEFDVQTEVLARTRAKLAQLEARLAELEKQQNQED